jgi:hypothetical protein
MSTASSLARPSWLGYARETIAEPDQQLVSDAIVLLRVLVPPAPALG